MKRLTTNLAVVLAVAVAGCGDDGGTEPVTITLMTHDSFAISDAALAAFTADTGVTVELLASGDTGQMVSEAILTAGNPLADVMFGVDNTFLQRALDADLFEPYESPNLADVDDRFELDPEHRVTPIDYGDVCVNYWIDALPGGVATPSTLEDLTDPAFAGELIVQNPETSSPGLAFLLATIAGTADWEQYWADLRANEVAVTAGWEDAYEQFTGDDGPAMMVSYASSPPAEVIFAAEPTTTAPTDVILDSCFRQIEFAGVLAGSDHPGAARRLIDFMLTPTFQDEVPLAMFVFPVADSATLPPEFVDHARIADDPLMLDPAEIEANRDEWTARWVEIVLG